MKKSAKGSGQVWLMVVFGNFEPYMTHMNNYCILIQLLRLKGVKINPVTGAIEQLTSWILGAILMHYHHHHHHHHQGVDTREIIDTRTRTCTCIHVYEYISLPRTSLYTDDSLIFTAHRLDMSLPI